MLSYFDSKEDYIAFKLAHKVVLETNIYGWQNTSLKVYDDNGGLCCFDGKPSVIETGRTNSDQSGRPIYSILWLNSSLTGYYRPASEGPSYIDARRYDMSQGGHIVQFAYLENGKRVEVTKEKAKSDIEKHFLSAHIAATGINRNKFTPHITSGVI